MPVVEQGSAEIAVLRTLPVRVLPEQGEALTSWLETLARRYSVSFADMTAALGISQNRSATAWLRMGNDRIDRVVLIAGLPSETVRGMTLHKYTDVLPGTYCTEHSGPFALWVRHQGARYCPQCLRGSEGRWKSAWYLSWTFACLTHRCLLVDECPQCHRRQRARSPGVGQMPAAGTRCRADILTSSVCEADLAQVAPLQLDAEDPVLAAQRTVDLILRGANPGFELYGGRPTELRHILADLRALTQWAYKSAHPSEFDDYGLNGAVVAVNDQPGTLARPYGSRRRRAGATPVAADVAAGVSQVLKVFTAEAKWSAPQILAELMSADSGVRSYRQPISARADLSPPLRQAIGSALVDVRRGRSMQRRFERTGARAAHAATDSGINRR